MMNWLKSLFSGKEYPHRVKTTSEIKEENQELIAQITPFYVGAADIEIVRFPKVSDRNIGYKISKWSKRLGERVTEGEPVFEFETHKATLQYAAVTSGFVIWQADDEQTFLVGEIACIIASQQINAKKIAPLLPR